MMLVLYLILYVVPFSYELSFSLKQNKEKCFVDFFDMGVGVVNYEIISNHTSVHLKFYQESNGELVSRHILKTKKGKFSFMIDKEGGYRICALNINSRSPIEISLKFESENINEIDIDKAINKDDIDILSYKIERGVEKTKKIIQKQKTERDSEEKIFGEQKKYSKIFICITLLQILVLVIIAIYHIIQMRKYLISHKIIE